MVRGQVQKNNLYTGIQGFIIILLVILLIGLNIGIPAESMVGWNVLLPSSSTLLGILYRKVGYKYTQWICEMAKDPHPELRYPNLKE